MEALNVKKMTRYFSNLSQIRVKCKCSHTMELYGSNTQVICTNCGNLIFKTKEAEFKYRMKEMINKKC